MNFGKILSLVKKNVAFVRFSQIDLCLFCEFSACFVYVYAV